MPYYGFALPHFSFLQISFVPLHHSQFQSVAPDRKPLGYRPPAVGHQSTGRMRSQIGSMDSYRKLPDCRPPTVGSQSSEWVPNSNIGSPGLWTADVGPLLQAPGRVRALLAPASLARDCSPPDWPAPAKVLSTTEEASLLGVCVPTNKKYVTSMCSNQNRTLYISVFQQYLTIIHLI